MPGSPHDNVEQLRSDIDSGRTKDKVQVSDPAAAPLGADEEAAGTPLASTDIRQARVQERGRAGRDHDKDRSRGKILWTLVVAASTAVFALGVIWLRT